MSPERPFDYGRYRLLLSAARAEPTGVMVALRPHPKIADKLALPRGTEDPQDLHLTLAFLGHKDGLDDPQKLHDAVAAWAKRTPIIEAGVSGTGVFTEGKDAPVTYNSVDASLLPEARQALVQNLKDAGLPVSDSHGFTPHITLHYGDKRQVDPPKGQKIRFTHAEVSVGADRKRYKLEGTG